jgi:heme-binding protein
MRVGEMRAVALSTAATVVTMALLSAPAAGAQPGCTASGLSSALGQVATATGGWLAAHPQAEAVINTANETDIRNYFVVHTAEWSELQGIAAPLRNLRNSCPQQVAPGQIAELFNAMAS